MNIISKPTFLFLNNEQWTKNKHIVLQSFWEELKLGFEHIDCDYLPSLPEYAELCADFIKEDLFFTDILDPKSNLSSDIKYMLMDRDFMRQRNIRPSHMKSNYDIWCTWLTWEADQWGGDFYGLHNGYSRHYVYENQNLLSDIEFLLHYTNTTYYGGNYPIEEVVA